MKKKVLLIEDDKIVRENTAEILELADYKVLTAPNGKIGVEKAKTFKPHIIICDILMPELDGYGVLHIVSNSPELEHIPFIFLTAKTQHESVRKGMELGADDYIRKPFEESELLRAIESRLKRVESFEHKSPNSGKPFKIQQNSLKNIKNIDKFLGQKEVFKYLKGATIYCEGNQSNHIFLVKKGLIKTYKTNDIGKELITGYYRDEQIFGYSSFARQLPHCENSKAVKNSLIYKISKDEISSIINNNHHIIYNFIDLLATDILGLKDRLLLSSYGSVRRKTAISLLNLDKTLSKNERGEFNISRIDLANTIGIAKETLIRTLHDFKEEGYLEINERGIRILKKNRLLKIQ